MCAAWVRKARMKHDITEQEWVEQLRGFLGRHAWLAECHTNAFFTQRLWEQVPPAWLHALAATPPSKLSAVPSGFSCPDWPRELRDFIDEARQLSLRATSDRHQPQQPAPQCPCQTQLERAVYEGMSVKKRYEVDRLACFVADVSARTAADVVIDVGAGQGHLSRVLAFRHGLNVVSVEAVASLTAAASSRALKLCRMKRCSACGSLQPPMCVTAAAWTPQELQMAVAGAFGTTTTTTRRRMLFVCLHGCGDLTPNVLRTFVECPDAVAVVAVGCCYNLLTEAGHPEGEERAAASRILLNTSQAGVAPVDAGTTLEHVPIQVAKETPGYPMSTALADHKLGRQARMLACQSAERWLNTDEARSWRGFAFRAALELASCSILNVDVSELRCGGAACDDATTFGSYVRELFSRAGIECPLEETVVEQWWSKELQEPASFMGPFCALRCVLAAPIEALVILDRVLYLREQLAVHTSCRDPTVMWQPIFDACISPRNVALIGLKDKMR